MKYEIPSRLAAQQSLAVKMDKVLLKKKQKEKQHGNQTNSFSLFSLLSNHAS